MLALIMEGERRHHRDPTVHATPWSSLFDDPKTEVGYSLSTAASDEGGDECGGELRIGESFTLPMLHRELLCSDFMTAEEEDTDELDFAVDIYSSDEFRMYEFKVRQCARGRPHDWTECPFAHPGEKARRRDPRKYHYSGTACPDFRKGGCSRGDACEFAHGVFECWLHPARYRTQPCKDGTACRRPVCFFAHTPDQLRILSSQHQAPAKTPAAVESYDGSPLRQLALESYISKHLMSPPISPPSGSPPASPSSAALHRASWPAGTSRSEIVASLRQLHLSKAKSLPRSWVMQLGNGLLASPRDSRSGFRAGFCSLPATPTTASMGGGGGMGWLDGVDDGIAEEEPAERLESGRALRAKMFEKLRKECVMDKGVAAPLLPAPDVGCVSELVK